MPNPKHFLNGAKRWRDGLRVDGNRESDKAGCVRRKYIQSTILDKTTWENVFINAHYLTQQNYSQINGFA